MKKEIELIPSPKSDEQNFYQSVAQLITEARLYAKRQIDSVMICTYYEIGRMIIEREQEGKKRAQYGKKLLEALANYLMGNVDKRFSAENLKLMRRFYVVYSADCRIGESAIPQFTPNVSWTHYIQLMRINNADERHFYEIETGRSAWTICELQRQFNSSLYDLGQLQMYVHYFDRYVKRDFEKPTVGILLCKEKNDSIVELTLPENSNIYASQYSLYLPDKALLQRKLSEWVQEFEDAHGGRETTEEEKT